MRFTHRLLNEQICTEFERILRLRRFYGDEPERFGAKVWTTAHTMPAHVRDTRVWFLEVDAETYPWLPSLMRGVLWANQDRGISGSRVLSSKVFVEKTTMQFAEALDVVVRSASYHDLDDAALATLWRIRGRDGIIATVPCSPPYVGPSLRDRLYHIWIHDRDYRALETAHG